MKHIVLKDVKKTNTYSTAILIKEDALVSHELNKYYVSKINTDSIIAFSLYYEGKKAPAVKAKEYLSKLLKGLDKLQVKNIFCADSTYFKYLTKVTKVSNLHGIPMPCKIDGYEHINIFLIPSYKATFYNPDIIEDINLTIKLFNGYLTNPTKILGQGALKKIIVLDKLSDIADCLENNLLNNNLLACDIEATSLKFYASNLVSISFSPNDSESYVIDVNIENIKHKSYQCQVILLLENFFREYKGKLIFHNANFDLKQLFYFFENIYSYFNLPSSPSSQKLTLVDWINLYKGRIHDTKVLAYLALNRTTDLDLSLKSLAYDYLGNYEEDMKVDIYHIPKDKLVIYNAKDTIGTFHLFNKYYPIVKSDNQMDIYNNLFMPSVFTVLQMETNGIPLNMNKVYTLKNRLLTEVNLKANTIRSCKATEDTLKKIKLEHFLTQDERWKVKRVNQDYFDNIEFDIGSTKDLTKLLYETLNLPIIEKTPTGKPSLKSKVLKTILNHHLDKDRIENKEKIIILESLIKIKDISKILNTFIKAFEENSIWYNDIQYYHLHGNYNVTGTVSGRMSSNSPNLQNLPSGSTYGAAIKECFHPGPGWLMMGADFDSLEDKISALTTKDPNKLKVYEEGYDSHSLRAYAYFKDQMPDIEDTIESINSIATKYPELRQKSKSPTFLLTYGGTADGLVYNVGLSQQEAIEIEENYHRLYKVSDEWKAKKISLAAKQGYLDVAFGLRVRTPILAKTILNTNSVTRESQAEGRTIGNALGQSYGLLNNRAANEFQDRVNNSIYKDNIKMIMQIHDSIYFKVKEDIATIKWFNDNLIECMEWDKLSELQHPKVKLTATTGIFYPSWANETSLKNKASEEEIKDLLTKIKKETKSNIYINDKSSG